MTDHALVTCPGCGGQVHPSALACPHCGYARPAQPSAPAGSGMGFVEAIKTCLSKYVVFEGRASRPEYWYFYLFNLLVSIGLGMLRLGALGGLISLALLLPNIAACSRRLHDMGRSGWNQLWSLTIIGIIPVVYWLTRPSEPGENRFGPEPGV